MNKTIVAPFLLLAAALPCQLVTHVLATVTSAANPVASAFDPLDGGIAVFGDGWILYKPQLGEMELTYVAPGVPVFARWGDVNGDGVPDVAVARGPAGVTVYFGPISPNNTWVIPGDATRVRLDDINNDGEDEVFISNPNALGSNGQLRIYDGATRNLMSTSTGSAAEGYGDHVAVEVLGNDSVTTPRVWVAASFYGSTFAGCIYELDPMTGTKTRVVTGTAPWGGLGRDGLEHVDGKLCACSQPLGIHVYDTTAPSLPLVHTGLGASASPYDMWVTRDEEAGKDLVVGLSLSGPFLWFDLSNGQALHQGNVLRPINTVDSCVGDIDGDGQPNVISITSFGTTHEMVIQTPEPVELRANQNVFPTATGGTQVLTGHVPSRAGQLFFAGTSFDFQLGAGPNVFGETLNFTTLVPFPDPAGAFGIVDAQGGFSLQWAVPPGFPGLSLLHVALTLDTQTMTANDTNLQFTRIE